MEYDVEQLSDFLEDYPDLSRYIDFDYALKNSDDFSSLNECILEQIKKIKITYCSAAIKILSEKDYTLDVSIALAAKYGMKLETINACDLATIIVKNKASGVWKCFSCDFEYYFFD